MLVLSDPESKKVVYHDGSSATSSWDSNDRIGDIFKSLWVNMVSTSHLKDNREDTSEPEELIQSNSDLWIKHLNTLWDTHFEQRKPPTEDKWLR